MSGTDATSSSATSELPLHGTGVFLPRTKSTKTARQLLSSYNKFRKQWQQQESFGGSCEEATTNDNVTKEVPRGVGMREPQYTLRIQLQSAVEFNESSNVKQALLPVSPGSTQHASSGVACMSLTPTYSSTGNTQLTHLAYSEEGARSDPLAAPEIGGWSFTRRHTSDDVVTGSITQPTEAHPCTAQQQHLSSCLGQSPQFAGTLCANTTCGSSSASKELATHQNTAQQLRLTLQTPASSRAAPGLHKPNQGDASMQANLLNSMNNHLLPQGSQQLQQQQQWQPGQTTAAAHSSGLSFDIMQHQNQQHQQQMAMYEQAVNSNSAPLPELQQTSCDSSIMQAIDDRMMQLLQLRQSAMAQLLHGPETASSGSTAAGQHLPGQAKPCQQLPIQAQQGEQLPGQQPPDQHLTAQQQLHLAPHDEACVLLESLQFEPDEYMQGNFSDTLPHGTNSSSNADATSLATVDNHHHYQQQLQHMHLLGMLGKHSGYVSGCSTPSSVPQDSRVSHDAFAVGSYGAVGSGRLPGIDINMLNNLHTNKASNASHVSQIANKGLAPGQSSSASLPVGSSMQEHKPQSAELSEVEKAARKAAVAEKMRQLEMVQRMQQQLQEELLQLLE